MKTTVFFFVAGFFLVSFFCSGCDDEPIPIPTREEPRQAVEDKEEQEDTPPPTMKPREEPEPAPEQRDSAVVVTNEIKWNSSKSDNPGPFSFVLVNSTQGNICEYYLWPVNSPRGQNRLTQGPLAPGEGWEVTGNSGSYHIAAADCAGNRIERAENIGSIVNSPHMWYIYAFPRP